MRISFRSFMERLNEAEAAPAMGAAPSSPENPDKSDKPDNTHHWDFLQRQFGIDDKSFDAVLENGVMDIWHVPDFSGKWGFVVNGPCSAQVEKQPSGSFKVKFMLRDKKSQRPFDFFMPYKQGSEQLNYYDGPVEDKTEIMTKDELQNAMADPMASAAGAAAPPMPGMPGAI